MVFPEQLLRAAPIMLILSFIISVTKKPGLPERRRNPAAGYRIRGQDLP